MQAGFIVGVTWVYVRWVYVPGGCTVGEDAGCEVDEQVVPGRDLV